MSVQEVAWAERQPTTVLHQRLISSCPHAALTAWMMRWHTPVSTEPDTAWQTQKHKRVGEQFTHTYTSDCTDTNITIVIPTNTHYNQILNTHLSWPVRGVFLQVSAQWCVRACVCLHWKQLQSTWEQSFIFICLMDYSSCVWRTACKSVTTVEQTLRQPQNHL